MRPERNGASGDGGALFAADVIAEGQEAVGEVDALKPDLLVVAGDLPVGEVPEPADAQLHQVVDSLLGHRLRDCQHSHIRDIIFAVVIQLLQVADQNAVDLAADQGW